MENDQRPGPYDAAIADVRKRIKQLENTLLVLEQLKAGGFPEVSDAGGTRAGSHTSGSNSPAPDTGPGAFLGMSIPDAAKKLLATQRRQMTTSEIAREIERGGVVLTSADKVNTVGSVLLRRFYQNGDIVRVSRGVWGLAAWYPGRKFHKGGSGGKADDNGSKDNHEESEAVGNEGETKPDSEESGDFGDLIG